MHSGWAEALALDRTSSRDRAHAKYAISIALHSLSMTRVSAKRAVEQEKRPTLGRESLESL